MTRTASPFVPAQVAAGVRAARSSADLRARALPLPPGSGCHDAGTCRLWILEFSIHLGIERGENIFCDVLF